jgi:hypothetical protein
MSTPRLNRRSASKRGLQLVLGHLYQRPINAHEHFASRQPEPISKCASGLFEHQERRFNLGLKSASACFGTGAFNVSNDLND